ncbi:hypothetical protein CS063_03020 [Sporanaerobium hydrogeniformans]|uniref:Uncharacterized protein n=1 Tax=Sporanaerobium hydrogeniformans TaxID=3072179 RepID=A0AC61DFU8_9FIRM|nr:DUF4190 domain-containing protein [Sporanaerobium hydrogeniformans]PHV71556.1 hypothetical protein CS063_03020 [Sporanaerobium hydrogeniformans]
MDEQLLGGELDFEEPDFDLTDEFEDMDTSINEPKSNNLNAWTSLILGIIGSLGWLVPIIGLPVTIVGTVLGAVSMKNKKNRGIGIAGFVVSTVFLVASIAKGIVDIVLYFKKTK